MKLSKFYLDIYHKHYNELDLFFTNYENVKDNRIKKIIKQQKVVSDELTKLITMLEEFEVGEDV